MTSLKRSDFFYDLPKELIAQTPAEPRDRSRLFVYGRQAATIEHRQFADIVEYLRPGDLLVINNTKVLPARLLGEKQPTGGKVEVFLLKKQGVKDQAEVWQVMLGGRVGEGLSIRLSERLTAEVLRNNNDGTWQAAFSLRGRELMAEVSAIGHMPLPPYIRKGADRPEDQARYQTVFARDSKRGSVAAPTAGLHFTPGLIKAIKGKGVGIAEVTLNVGLGTFAPVKAARIADHRMHSEWYEVPKKTIDKIIAAKKCGGRVIAVGTTAARTLESAAGLLYLNSSSAISGWTSIFIYPPYEFRIVDGLVTNFHLPESTLLMMLAAFLDPSAGSGQGAAGIKIERKLYAEAIRERYRFFSYGDAMLIL